MTLTSIAILDLAGQVFLVDTNVVSEMRKGDRAHAGVRAFFRKVHRSRHPVYLSVITVGEIRKGVSLIQQRGADASHLVRWLEQLLVAYDAFILDFSLEEAQVWGQLLATNEQHPIDKQIAATALCYDLTVVTRNTADFSDTTVRTLNPFE